MSGEIDENEELENELEEDIDEEESVSEDDAVEGMMEATVVDDDVASLVARMDKTDESEAARKRAIRRKLEEASERKQADLDQTFNFNIDDEL